MAENRHSSEPRHAAPPPVAEGFDRELAIRRIVDVGLATAGISIAAFLVIVVLYRGLAKQEAALDPAPSPIPEANARPARPEPHLQETPELDLAALRRAQQTELEGYAWVDRGAGLARIPIERAIELTLARGLAPLPATAAAGADATAPEPAPASGEPTPLSSATADSKTPASHATHSTAPASAAADSKAPASAGARPPEAR